MSNHKDQNPFTPRTTALLREGYVIRSCICVGLTELRRAFPDDPGSHYAAFFQISIGIERLSKLILILNQIVSTTSVKPNLRKAGHNIKTLYEQAQAIAQTRDTKFSAFIELEPLDTDILLFLSNFAVGARYRNLDFLSSNTNEVEPLVAWLEIRKKIIDAHLSPTKQRRYREQAHSLNTELDAAIQATKFDLSGDSWSAIDYHYDLMLGEFVARHLTWHCYKLIAPLTKLVSALSHAAQVIYRDREYIPDMGELFREFTGDMPKQYVMGRKRWNVL